MEIQYRHDKANAHWQRPILAPGGKMSEELMGHLKDNLILT